jgi:hypothetical protein
MMRWKGAEYPKRCRKEPMEKEPEIGKYKG